ncbi:hypothetical protein E2C01_036978 [Portunus trituberculatus]|uniref:Secreted protein n=1 Tax=Portunus trituberculatus TaxID=210409 RepID=A0A5B7FFU1_PORTR|nr:hypothetical protein [Portunus trituberculatus]
MLASWHLSIHLTHLTWAVGVRPARTWLCMVALRLHGEALTLGTTLALNSCHSSTPRQPRCALVEGGEGEVYLEIISGTASGTAR